MDSSVKDFDESFAFVSEGSRRCSEQPSFKLHSDIHLSKIITYLYMTSSYLSDTTDVVVPEPYHSVLKYMFGQHEGILKEDPHSDELDDARSVVVLSVVAYNSSLRNGKVLMPVFVPSTSAVVHNIYEANSKLISEDNATQLRAHIEGCLNFFNGIVRADKGGISKIIWKDPVSQDTKLQTFSYDRMFALYVCDKYMKRVDASYTNYSLEKRLATCLSCFDVLEEESSKVKIPIKKVTRNINTYAPATTPAWPIAGSDQSFVEEDEVVLTENPRSHYYTAIMAFLSLSKVKKSSTFKAYIHGSFSDYSFLLDLMNLFPNSSFHVWCREADVLPERPRVKKDTSRAVIPYGEYKDTYLVSLLPPDALLKGFKEGASLVLTKHTMYAPSRLIMPVFGGKTADIYSMISPDFRVVMSPEEKRQIQTGASNVRSKFDYDHRDTRRWGYTYKPVGSKSTTTGPYDLCYMKLVESKIIS